MPGFQPLLAPTMWSVALTVVATAARRRKKRTERSMSREMLIGSSDRGSELDVIG